MIGVIEDFIEKEIIEKTLVRDFNLKNLFKNSKGQKRIIFGVIKADLKNYKIDEKLENVKIHCFIDDKRVVVSHFNEEIV